jgi:hypothetical protein
MPAPLRPRKMNKRLNEKKRAPGAFISVLSSFDQAKAHHTASSDSPTTQL